MSSTTMKAPSMVPSTPTQVRKSTGFSSMLGISCFWLYPNLGVNGETWNNQLLVPSNAGSIEKDFDGNPLHDFREIPSCVIRRKQGKHCAGSRLEAVDLTSEFVIGKSIHADLDRLAERCMWLRCPQPGIERCPDPVSR
jgi:hypothetical protein